MRRRNRLWRRPRRPHPIVDLGHEHRLVTATVETHAAAAGSGKDALPRQPARMPAAPGTCLARPGSSSGFNPVTKPRLHPHSPGLDYRHTAAIPICPRAEIRPASHADMHGTLNPPRLSPQDAARWQKAQEQLLAGRSGPALAGYRQLAARHPNLPLLWFELGNAASAALDFKQADAVPARAATRAAGCVAAGNDRPPVSRVAAIGPGARLL